jgi:hypothetical protein
MVSDGSNIGAGPARPYELSIGGNAIKAINGFQLIFVGKDTPESPDEKLYVSLINGAVGNLTDGYLRKCDGSLRDGNLLPKLLEKRVEWLDLLCQEAQDFLNPRYSLCECMAACSTIIGDIQASIRCLLEQNRGKTRVRLGMLAESAHNRNQELIDIATFRRGFRQLLHVSAGIMALFAGTISVAISSGSPSTNTAQLISAVIAFLSGIITLLASTYFDEKETATIFDGAPKFLSLGNKCDSARENYNMTESELFATLETLQALHVELSNTYNHFRPWTFSISRIFNFKR